MSLIGIDAGTSAVKVGVYREDGELLALARQPVTGSHPCPGRAELDPDAVWRATREGLAEVAAVPAVRADPPRALAISAPGDSAFPVDAAFQPLGPCLLPGDARGSELEEPIVRQFAPAEWYRRCGHLPARMDPVNRVLWWRANEPRVYMRTAKFVGWHAFLTQRLCDRAVKDGSLAAKWLAFDLATRQWSPQVLDRFDLPVALFPEVQTWGQERSDEGAVGEILPSMARELGLPHGLTVGVGGYDSLCSALGSGVSGAGTVGLACGSWEVVVAPTPSLGLLPRLVASHSPLVPYPGEAPFAVLAQSPNGASVVEWATRLLGVPPDEIEAELASVPLTPSPVLAVPHLSEPLGLSAEGRNSRAALVNMTLATTRSEVLQGFLEGVAFELTDMIQSVRNAGVEVEVLRAAGGGTRSAWWMQLKADLTGVPIEVVELPEPGTFGAALLAGAAVGVYPSAGEAARQWVRVARQFAPDERRRDLYAQRFAEYHECVRLLLAEG
jgi:xylulokinase